jgi:hypothetical protein
MATAQLYWNNGTSDRITVMYDGAAGRKSITVSSDRNMSGASRSRGIRLLAQSGALLATLVVRQEGVKGSGSTGTEDTYDELITPDDHTPGDYTPDYEITTPEW